MTEEVKLEEIEEVVDISEVDLENLLERSELIDSKCSDYTVTRANNSLLRLNDLAGITYIPDESDIGDTVTTIRSVGISKYALTQLCGKIGVPTQYVTKCIDSGRLELAQDNVNSWLEDFNKDLLIREHDNKIRGVLSSRYSICDSHEILEVVDKVLDLSKYTVKGSYISPERLHLRLVDKVQLPVEGEDLFAGIMIDSSDVGRSILSCNFFIYKQVCTNGLVSERLGATLFKQKHIGITAEEFRDGLAEGLTKVELLTENSIELIRRTMEANPYFTRGATLEEEQVEKFIEEVKLRAKLPQKGAEKVVDFMNTKYRNNRWGYINALTEVAQDYTLDRRIDIEKYAGSLLVS